MPYHLACPQCGAPIELGETEHSVECPYCRVRHLLVSQNHITCKLNPGDNVPADDIIYVPYWRFKGLAFAMHGPRVTHRIIDVSSQAAQATGMPLSLGLRSQTQPLHFIKPDTRARFLPVTIPKKHLLHQIGSRLLGFGPQCKTAPMQSYIGDLVQLIYSPAIVGNSKVFDAITQKEIPGSSADTLRQCSTPYAGSSPSFLPALCPHCGWDLRGNKESLAQVCTHCHRLWASLQGGLRSIEFRFAGQAEQGCLWFPFWQMNVDNAQASLHNRADLMRLANLPKIPTPKDSNAPLQFTIPAFKLNPSLFLRLARQTTVFQFPEVKTPTLDDDLFPSSLPLTEAWQAISPLVYDLSRDKAEMLSILADSGFRLKHCTMLFLPFVRRGMELIQPDMNVSIPANAVMFGQSL